MGHELGPVKTCCVRRPLRWSREQSMEVAMEVG